ncbi:Inositol polyphosphate 5-phosphatase OCRL-1 [Sesbania bispinosa]|nr:Inositol polyphosphate 5-phosphatase OCRL-1 [Sesbania bispinosa]
MPPKSQMTKTMDEVAMLRALRAKERKAKAAEKNAATSVECPGTGPVQHVDGTNSLAQRKKKDRRREPAWRHRNQTTTFE